MNFRTRTRPPPKTARTRARRRMLLVYEELDDVDIPEAALGPGKTTPSGN